ncbi:hypothetical protein ACFVOK_09245 [Streptomyces sp. NPDC057798]|uniref:hypothetical protein n=1 Tax=Streptomyces sp. NPDC057798 TaxID=3346252 RepID=UPI0036C4F2CC
MGRRCGSSAGDEEGEQAGEGERALGVVGAALDASYGADLVERYELLAQLRWSPG